MFGPLSRYEPDGLLYGADLLGGWSGGIIAAVTLLPVLGLVGTSLVVALIKASSLVMLATPFGKK
jgi:spermidine synthase